MHIGLMTESPKFKLAKVPDIKIPKETGLGWAVAPLLGSDVGAKLQDLRLVLEL